MLSGKQTSLDVSKFRQVPSSQLLIDVDSREAPLDENRCLMENGLYGRYGRCRPAFRLYLCHTRGNQRMGNRARVMLRRAKYTLGASVLDLLIRRTSILDGESPPSLINYAGGGDYKLVGSGLARMLQVRADLVDGESLLDVGCGIGRLATALSHDTPNLRYDGFDPVRYGISWCTKRFRDVPNYRFAHVDLANPFYNPGGSIDPQTFRFPYQDCAFDIVVATSVFTHMRLETSAHYLEEIARCLRPGGRAYITLFRIDAHATQAIQRGDSLLAFRRMGEGEWASTTAQAEEAIAFEHSALQRALDRSALEAVQFYRGSWRTGTGDDYQDGWLLRLGDSRS
jgi:SAM-dependent methyltransferase